MTSSLNDSRRELQDLIQTLESKVTERTKELLAARAEVAQGEKLASIGVLASGIAHELNNPLTGVLTFTSLMRKKTPEGSEDAEDLDLVIRETKRCASIIKRLLDFAREKTPVKGFFNINQRDRRHGALRRTTGLPGSRSKSRPIWTRICPSSGATPI